MRWDSDLIALDLRRLGSKLWLCPTCVWPLPPWLGPIDSEASDMPHIIVWDIETVPDLRGFAAAHGHDGKSDDDT